MITSRFRLGALFACALLAVVVGSTAAADDTTSPTLSIGTTPQNPTPGTDVTITATVTPGTNPDSTGLAVNCNLSWSVQGGNSAALDPDVTGLVFSRTVTVPSNAVPGGRIGSCTVMDDQGRSTQTPYSITIAAPETDSAPTLSGHTPADGATGVAVNANIGITFSEPVDVTGSWFSIDCTTSGSHDAVVTGGPTAFVLDPADDFAAGETCTVTLDGTLITDQDTNDPPNALEGSPSWSFTTAAAVNQPPTVSAGGPYMVAEGGSVQLAATGIDPEGGPLSYAWDLDNNGSYETPGRTPTFSAAALDGPATRTVGVQVTDNGGATATGTATVNVANVAPTATFGAPASSPAGFAFTLSLTSPQDPSAADSAAGFTYAFDCGSGFGAFGSASTASCPASDVGTLTVGGMIRDRDGDVTGYSTTVRITVSFDSLCDLIRSYATDPKVADDLCAKLAQAASAPTPTARAGLLGAFRNQVDAKVDKGLTADQAAELKLLSTRL